ncbi:hypothetical protein Fcan01_24874 [Folsomia candida]|uniref:Ricin B lectin domain-containing protein n=1 Tax=Folsomia candida TaxID=158441 RepID=A0A226D654_FOLCA|nr:hypothetical protein Fcan01_24874 [Folsomia candida]
MSAIIGIPSPLCSTVLPLDAFSHRASQEIAKSSPATSMVLLPLLVSLALCGPSLIAAKDILIDIPVTFRYQKSGEFLSSSMYPSVVAKRGGGSSPNSVWVVTSNRTITMHDGKSCLTDYRVGGLVTLAPCEAGLSEQVWTLRKSGRVGIVAIANKRGKCLRRIPGYNFVVYGTCADSRDYDWKVASYPY